MTKKNTKNFMVFMIILVIFPFCYCDGTDFDDDKQKFITLDSFIKVRIKASWETYDIEENPFKDYTIEEIKSLLVAKLRVNKKASQVKFDSIYNSFVLQETETSDDEIPKNFDSRTNWPNCVKHIRAQLKCGACWAFSASSVLSDRFCIASNEKVNIDFSPQDLISCDKKNSGCTGGAEDNTWSFFETEGIVSEDCFPYQTSDPNNVPECTNTCTDTNKSYKKYKVIPGSSKAMHHIIDIQREILTYGPVQTGFLVYEDFMHYKGGIYKNKYGKEYGGHAVKLVGWAEEADEKYWIAANSWGESWGEAGYFRIGFDECLIDSNAYAGHAQITKDKNFLQYIN